MAKDRFYRLGASFYRHDRGDALPEGAVEVPRLPKDGERWDDKADRLVADEDFKAERRKRARRRDPEAFAELEARVDALEAALANAGISIDQKRSDQ